MNDEIDTTTAEGYMLEDRRLSHKDRSRLSKADWRGDDFYYLPGSSLDGSHAHSRCSGVRR